MTATTERVLAFFDMCVFGAMRDDIDAAIRGNATSLAALGLVSYTEILGGLVTGNVAIPRNAGKNFDAFLPYLGRDYEGLRSKRINLYNIIRCGLVHQYFIKGPATLLPKADAPCGIIASSGGRTYFIVNVYRDHLFAGAVRYRNALIEGSSADLIANFERGSIAINPDEPWRN